MRTEKNTKATILMNMDKYVRDHVEDEDAFEYWLTFGVPDGADEDMFLELAEDTDTFNGIARVFSRLVSQYDFDKGRAR